MFRVLFILILLIRLLRQLQGVTSIKHRIIIDNKNILE